MAKFYSAPVVFLDGSTATATCVGNNAGWNCKCGTPLVGPHEDIYLIDACPGANCEREYRIRRGSKPNYVLKVEQVA